MLLCRLILQLRKPIWYIMDNLCPNVEKLYGGYAKSFSMPKMVQHIVIKTIKVHYIVVIIVFMC